ncbi:MAG: TVP38/TMEM64 family protein [Actinomycetota bacterium]|nr:TVP38/TMEM64 family protein [Actinomycetota bacterium]
MAEEERAAVDRRPAARLVDLVSSPRFRFAVLVVLLTGGGTAVLLIGGPSRAGVQRFVESAGVAAPLVYVLVYAGLTVLLVPGAVLTIAGGVLFGTAAGTALAVVGASLGAAAAFAAGRRLGREQVERMAGKRLGSLDRWLERRGFLAVLYLRLFPVVPFNALNYLAGVTGLRTRDYVSATVVGIVPGAFAYAALGGSFDDPTAPEFIAAVSLLIVLVIGGPFINRLLRRRGAGPPELPDAGQTEAANADATDTEATEDRGASTR